MSAYVVPAQMSGRLNDYLRGGDRSFDPERALPVPPTHTRALCVLRILCWEAGEGTEVKIGLDELAALAGCSMSTVRRALNEVVALGFVVKIGGGNQKQLTRWRLQIPVSTGSALFTHDGCSGSASLTHEQSSAGVGASASFTHEQSRTPASVILDPASVKNESASFMSEQLLISTSAGNQMSRESRADDDGPAQPSAAGPDKVKATADLDAAVDWVAGKLGLDRAAAALEVDRICHGRTIHSSILGYVTTTITRRGDRGQAKHTQPATSKVALVSPEDQQKLDTAAIEAAISLAIQWELEWELTDSQGRVGKLVRDGERAAVLTDWNRERLPAFELWISEPDNPTLRQQMEQILVNLQSPESIF